MTAPDRLEAVFDEARGLGVTELTWWVRTDAEPGTDEMVVIDPGPDDKDEHIERLAALGVVTVVVMRGLLVRLAGGLPRRRCRCAASRRPQPRRAG